MNYELLLIHCYIREKSGMWVLMHLNQYKVKCVDKK